AFDSNGQKVKFTGLKYNFKNGAVEENKDNIIESDEFDYSVSGSTLTIKELGNGEDLIATINSDGSIKDNEGSVMKEFKGNLYAIAEAEADEKRLLAKAHIVIVNGAVSGNTLTLGEGEETMTGSLSDESIIFIDPEDNSKQIFKRMKL
ncbi:hypothetical protein, partial [uncultured Treponema sp.]|uniref:hypothetical protein n=1 Tax=uncultured Treponema sp. TaxID=162155 RepID=UPI0025834B07